MTEIIVVDGGASCCRLAAYTPEGCELARVSLDCHASLTQGVQSAWEHIEQGLMHLAQALKHQPDWLPEHLILGLAGSLQEQRRSEFLNLTPSGCKTMLVTDGYAQLMGATEGEPGVCLAVGTGSVLHWHDAGGRSGMAGGWGFPVGDEGSGAWIGVQALKALLKCIDQQQSGSSLLDALVEHIGADISGIQRWTTESRATVFARLAPMVFAHADAGDRIAQAIVAKAVDKCLALIAMAPEDLPVYVLGSVGLRLQPTLASALGTRLCEPRHDALKGLWIISTRDT